METSGQKQSDSGKDTTAFVKIGESNTDKEGHMRQHATSASALPEHQALRRKSILKEHLSKSSPIEIFNKQHAHFADVDLTEMASSSPSSASASPSTLSFFPKEPHPRVMELTRPLTPTSPSAMDSYLEPMSPCTDMGRKQSKTFDTFQLMKDLDDFRP